MVFLVRVRPKKTPDPLVLMRTEIVLDWFGYSDDDLRRELQPAVEQVERGDVADRVLQEFLAEMHSRHDAKTAEWQESEPGRGAWRFFDRYGSTRLR